MVRRKKGKLKKKDTGKTGDDRDSNKASTHDWSIVARTNRLYKEYYKEQKIARDEEDFKEFMSTMCLSLPATIRLNSVGKFTDVLKTRLKGDLSEGYPVELTEDEFSRSRSTERLFTEPPKPIPWYPDECAWKFCASRNVLRKAPGFAKLKDFLIHESAMGTINRQEEASMIPPFFLDVQPHHKVLDMCAAPGSKTAQLLEMLHRDDFKNGFKPPSGLVVANDASASRAYMLANQLKRISSPNVVVTHHEAQLFPGMNRVRSNVGPEGQEYFDRILADVPCSGDGTCRKALDIFKKWSSGDGMVLHPVQNSIAHRGLRLLKVGGLMVYSTCSLNPIENEAVVANLLRVHKGKVELVDCSSVVPELKRRSGLSTWKVAVTKRDKTKEDVIDTTPNEDGLIDGCKENLSLKWVSTLEEAKVEDGHRMYPSFFPPTEEEVKEFHLERCMRIMPHDQDTSGFFICVLRKTASFHGDGGAEEEDEDEAKTESNTEKPNVNDKRNSETEGIRDDDLIPVTDDVWKKLEGHFGITNAEDGRPFPGQGVLFRRLGGGEMLTANARKRRKLERDEGKNSRIISIVSDDLAEIIKDNQRQVLHIVTAGAVAFKKNTRTNNSEDLYRVAHTGMRILLPHISKRIVECTWKDIALHLAIGEFKPTDPQLKARIVRYPGVPTPLMSQHFRDSWRKVRATGDNGSTIVVLGKEDQKRYVEEFGEPFGVSAYVTDGNTNLMIANQLLITIMQQSKRAGIVPEEACNPIDCAAIVKEHYPEVSEVTKSVEQEKEDK